MRKPPNLLLSEKDLTDEYVILPCESFGGNYAKNISMALGCIGFDHARVKLLNQYSKWLPLGWLVFNEQMIGYGHGL